MLAGLIPEGDIDQRSIRDVKPDDLRGYTQCHFFAGIGGWTFALQLAGWPDDREVWTGSCPCQPFSAAGERRGFDDPRHLWPEYYRLIGERRPSNLFGEQVATAKLWIDVVFADLERIGYACGAAVLPAVAVDAKHKRDRLWFGAHAASTRLHASARAVIHSREACAGARHEQPERLYCARTFGALADPAQQSEREPPNQNHAVAAAGQTRPVSSGNGEFMAHADCQSPVGLTIARQERPTWRSEPEMGRVVDGISHKLVEGELKGFGNAIVPQVAAEFIKAFLACRP